MPIAQNRPQNATKSAESLIFNHYLRTGAHLTGAAAQAFLETKSRGEMQAQQQGLAESALFSQYLRTGVMLAGEAATEFLEQKFNPYHDPEDGRFTFGPGGGSLAPRQANSPSSRRTPSPTPRSTGAGTTGRSPNRSSANTDPVAKRQRDIGSLAAKFESRRLEGPGTISSGRNDPGGVSYGTFQLSSNRRKIHEFVASPEASTWAAQLRGKQPATRQFDETWRAIAAADPGGFESAQRAFIVRTNYSEGARQVRQSTGYELENAHPAVRQAFFSTAVQHGPTGASGLFGASLRIVAGRVGRSDPRYESALINALYDSRNQQRERYAAAARLRAARLTSERNFKEANDWLGRARLADNDVDRRYPRERYDALLLLSGQPMSGL